MRAFCDIMELIEIKISADFDNTIARTHDLICPLLSFKTGKTIRYNDVTSWDYFREAGLWDDFTSCIDFIDANKLRQYLKPYDKDTYEVLHALSISYDVTIITANNGAASKGIYQWLDKFGIRNVDVKCIGRKTATAKLSLPYDIFIDDNPNMANGKSYLLIPDQPWNRSVKNSKTVKRFKTWSSVPKLIEEHHAR